MIPGLDRGGYRLVARTSVETSIDFHVADESSRGRMAAERPDRLDWCRPAPHHPEKPPRSSFVPRFRAPR